MSVRLQLRRGSAVAHASFTGAAGEVTVDTTDKRVVVHDGSTAGGIPMAKESELGGAGGALPVEQDVASASTTDIGAVAGELVRITGTTTITSFGTEVNRKRFVRFAGALLLTHNGTSLNLPGGANITTVAGDRCIAISDNSGNWRVVDYTRADGTPISFDFSGLTEDASPDGANDFFLSYDASATAPKKAKPSNLAATQSDQETATSSAKFVTPGRQHFHPSAAKCWAVVTVSGGTPTLQSSYNVTSITDTGTGQLTVTIANDFSSANWACVATLQAPAAGPDAAIANGERTTGIAAGSVLLGSLNISGSYIDPARWWMAGFGDL